MISFSDLKFNNGNARVHFDNGYGVSVSYRSEVCGKHKDQEYSISILKGNYIDMDNPLTKELWAYKTIKDINNILKIVQGYELQK